MMRRVRGGGVSRLESDLVPGPYDLDLPAACEQRGNGAGQGQRGLARPRCSGQGEEPSTSQPVNDGLDLGIPPEELVGVVGAVRPEASIRAVVADPRLVPHRRQRRIVAQDGGLEISESLAGFDSEIVVEPASGRAKSRQSLGLPAGLVVRQREQAPSLLAVRALAHEPLGFGDGRPVLTEGEPGGQQLLLARLSHGFEARALCGCGFPLGEFRVGRTAPELERAPVRRGGALGVIGRGVPAGGFDKLLETRCIEGFGIHGERISRGRGLDRAGADRAADESDDRLQLLRPRAGQVIAPQRVRESR